MGMGRDPVAGEPLGKAFPEYAPVAERIRQRVEQFPGELGSAGRAGAVAQSEAEETAREPAGGGRVRLHVLSRADFSLDLPAGWVSRVGAGA
jgi:hypothetical protein